MNPLNTELKTPKLSMSASPSTDNEKRLLDQQYEKLELRFKQLQGAQNVLDKLGHLLVVGSLQTETKISAALKTLKPLIRNKSASAIEKISAIEAQLREYGEWIEQSNSTLTPYGVRQYIKQDKLTREDLLALARYLSTRSSNLIDERGNIELFFSELCKDLSFWKKERLLYDLFPEPPLLSPAAQEIIDQLNKLKAEIESVIDFPQLIEGGYLARARRLKFALGPELWHPEGLSAVCALNLTLKNCFQSLFNSERHFIKVACRKLLSAKINPTVYVGEGGGLDIEAAGLAEQADGLLEENYHTNMQTLHRLARIGRWMRHASDILDEQTRSQPVAVAGATLLQTKAEPKHTLEPISTAPDEVNVIVLEQQLQGRIEEITEILMAQSQHSSIDMVHLKHTKLPLGKLETEAMLSQGHLLESTLRLQQYNLIRRSIALIAELQESAAIFADGTGPKRSKYYLSMPAMAYFLELNQRTQGELEVMSQATREQGDIDTALILLSLRNRLQQAYDTNWKVIVGLFPMIKPGDLGLYTPAANPGVYHSKQGGSS